MRLRLRAISGKNRGSDDQRSCIHRRAGFNPSMSGPENLEKAEARRDYVLNAMLKLNYISEAEFKQASEEKLTFVPNAPDRGIRSPISLKRSADTSSRNMVKKHL